MTKSGEGSAADRMHGRQTEQVKRHARLTGKI